MKPKAKRPVAERCQASPRCLRNDGREMPAGSSPIAAVRKELRGVARGAAADVVDPLLLKAGIPKLQVDQGGQVTMGFRVASPNDSTAASRAIHLARNLFADFKCVDTNVRTDRGEQLVRIVGEHLDGPMNDACDRAAPSGVHGGNLPAWRMRDQDWHAVCRSRGHCESVDPCDQGVSLLIRECFGRIP